MKFKQRVKRRPYTEPAKPETVLKRALELAESGEWVKGDYVREIDDDELGFCAVGMIRASSGAEFKPEKSMMPNGGGVDIFKSNRWWMDDIDSEVYLEALNVFLEALGKKSYGADEWTPIHELIEWAETDIINYNDKDTTNLDQIINALADALGLLGSGRV